MSGPDIFRYAPDKGKDGPPTSDQARLALTALKILTKCPEDLTPNEKRQRDALEEVLKARIQEDWKNNNSLTEK